MGIRKPKPIQPTKHKWVSVLSSKLQTCIRVTYKYPTISPEWNRHTRSVQYSKACSNNQFSFCHVKIIDFTAYISAEMYQEYISEWDSWTALGKQEKHIRMGISVEINWVNYLPWNELIYWTVSRDFSQMSSCCSMQKLNHSSTTQDNEQCNAVTSAFVCLLCLINKNTWKPFMSLLPVSIILEMVSKLEVRKTVQWTTLECLTLACIAQELFTAD